MSDLPVSAALPARQSLRFRLAPLVAGLAVLGAAATTDFGDLRALFLFLVMVVSIGLTLYFAADGRGAEELRALGNKVREVAVLEERNRLAREIHDGLGGVLSSVVIQSEYLLNMIDGSEVRARMNGNTEARAAIIPTLRKELSELHEAAEDSMDELRRSLRMMQDHFDLVSALEDHCRVAGARHRLAVQFSREGRERAVGPESALALFRVLQEGLTNVARHCGEGTRVDVSLAFAEGSATLVVRDHGPGFDLEDAARRGREGHYGLANMRERARKVSGTVRIRSAAGQGTTIELVVHAGEERSG